MTKSTVLHDPEREGPCVPARDLEKVVRGFALVLEGLGIPPTEHTKDTPRRAAKAWWNELCAGLIQERPEITTFESKVDSLIVSRGIPIRSMCAHHLLPFSGVATIAYIPGDGKILGLSKLSRIADYWSRRPQVQEELTEQIADAIWDFTRSEDHKGGVGVMIQARHMCMELRGVKHASDMVTSALRGVLRKDDAARAEFLKFASL
jgi:GTP cyclohydrolase I